MLSTIVAQYCFRRKRHPKFPSLDTLDKEVKSIPALQDKEIQQHFIRVYKAIKGLIEDKAKVEGLSELALFHPRFVNIWDLGVNRAHYHFLASGASQCERLVIVLFVDLEKDVSRLDTPPDIAGKKPYTQRGDDKLVMKILSRLHYLLLLAGFKRWFNRSSLNPKAPEAIIVGLHTKEFATISGGKKLAETVDHLQRAVLVEADKMGISNVLVPKVPTFCSNANNQSDELNKLKATIEELVHSQDHAVTVFDAKCMFLRSLMYGDDKPMLIRRKDVARLASKCGIYFEDELDDFLRNCRDTGSLLFYPKAMNRFLYDNIALDVLKPLRLLDRLYYLLTYSADATKGIGTLATEDIEQYRYGIISKKLASRVFKDEDVDSFLLYLSKSQVCVDISLSGHQEKYFFPSIRTSVDMSAPNKYSLFIKYDNEFLHSACLTLFVKFLNEFFLVPSEALLSHTKDYNTVLFKIYETPSTKPTDVLVISHIKRSLVEVRITDLEEKVNLELCSKLVHLSHKVFQHLGEHLQYLKFSLCVRCPVDDSHFAQFYLRYHQSEIYCQDCKKSVLIADSRICWLS